eukprot:TRINITY_DN51806_c0_g1_i1.p2 TRINITY_DN51806_c0_g1~~TRINITY_DN51806_c0_g1_i1.p2  ORF type:complete len:300 (+),score=130.24 TRINITY_DN51806_c0_g1_i1:106-900(+)
MGDDPRRQDAEKLFDLWDLDGSRAIEFPELQQVLFSAEMKDFEPHLSAKHGKKLIAKLKGRLAEAGRLRPMAKEEFTKFILELIDKDDWAKSHEHLKAAIERTREVTHPGGDDRRKRVQWSLFQLLDINQDGKVEWSELQQLLDTRESGEGRHPSKDQRKTAAKWRADLQEKGQGKLEPLELREFHKFMEELFEKYTDDEYVDAITDMQEHLSKHNSEAAHRQYMQEEKIPDLLNDIVSHVLEQKKDDPLESIIEFLEKRQSEA